MKQTLVIVREVKNDMGGMNLVKIESLPRTDENLEKVAKLDVVKRIKHPLRKSEEYIVIA